MIFLYLSFPGLLCRNRVSLPGAPNHWCGLPGPGKFSSGDFLESPQFGSLFGGVFMPLKTGISQDAWEPLFPRNREE